MSRVLGEKMICTVGFESSTGIPALLPCSLLLRQDYQKTANQTSLYGSFCRLVYTTEDFHTAYKVIILSQEKFTFNVHLHGTRKLSCICHMHCEFRVSIVERKSCTALPESDNGTTWRPPSTLCNKRSLRGTTAGVPSQSGQVSCRGRLLYRQSDFEIDTIVCPWKESVSDLQASVSFVPPLLVENVVDKIVMDRSPSPVD